MLLFYLIGFNINSIKKEGGCIAFDSKQLADQLLAVIALQKNTPSAKKSQAVMGTENFILTYLGDHPDKATPRELSQRFNVTVARVSTVLKHLEGKQLISRTINPTDKRKFIFELTELGRSKVTELNQDRYNDLVDLVEYLGEKDAKDYIRILKKLAVRNVSET